MPEVGEIARVVEEVVNVGLVWYDEDAPLAIAGSCENDGAGCVAGEDGSRVRIGDYQRAGLTFGKKKYLFIVYHTSMFGLFDS